MNAVDFLPNDYRVQEADQRLHVWWFSALIGYALIFGSIGGYQYLAAKSVQTEHQGLQPLYDQAVITNSRFQQLQKDLGQIREKAQLYAYLQHPWPRTQLLSALLEPVPEALTFQQITLKRKPLPRTGPPSPIPPTTSGVPDPTQRVKQTLEQLRNRYDGSQLIVTVQGITRDHHGLNQCIASWDRSRLFDNVQLDSLDALEDAFQTNSASFEITFLLTPGYGQSGGPTGPSHINLASSP